MNIQEICQYFDHTILKANATRDDVLAICEDAKQHSFKGVCVNGYWLPQVVSWLSGTDVLPVAVLGFPLGANLTTTKVAETKHLVDAGAKELDMVINVGEYLAGERQKVIDDIAAVHQACAGVPLKVIIETAYLNPEGIRDLTEICIAEKVAFIKTSTGMAASGAKEDDVRLMKEVIDAAGSPLKIKASGGIRSLKDFEKMAAAGATRIGASASVGIVQEFKDRQGL